MSADNGIYVLRTPKKGTKEFELEFYEYRVAMLQAIDNLYYDERNGEDSKETDVMIGNAREMFKNASVFTNEADAMHYAIKLYREYDIVEYGIVPIEVDEYFE